MNIREIFGQADVTRMVKVAEIVWREANTAFCSEEQVEYMIERLTNKNTRRTSETQRTADSKKSMCSN